MKFAINKKIKRLAIAVGFGLIVAQPAMAVLEGSLRNQLEFLDYSERLIHNGIYPVMSHDVFDKDKGKFVHGIPLQNAPIIYQPDVYTWELAMAKHRKKIALKQPQPTPLAPPMAPVPMTPPPILPSEPANTKLIPTGPKTNEVTGALPANANAIMNSMIYRARARGINPNTALRASQLKQELIDNMKQLGKSKQIPALMPALPRGHKGDSFDSSY